MTDHTMTITEWDRLDRLARLDHLLSLIGDINPNNPVEVALLNERDELVHHLKETQ